MDGGADLADL